MEQKALRLIINQSQANYRREETIENKMTYPLPPYSTVIGALHNACGFREYHPMDLSIQGSFESMQKEPYTDHAFLNNLNNDRNNLVKFGNGNMLSKGYHLVARAKKRMGNDFDKEITIDFVNRDLLTEYQNLRRAVRAIADKCENPTYDFQSSPMLFIGTETIEFTRRDILEKVKEVWEIKANHSKVAAQIKGNKDALKKTEKSTPEYQKLDGETKALVQTEKQLKADIQKAREPIDEVYSKYASLTTSLKFYEVLYGLKLVIHVVADDDTLNAIVENIGNLRSIGRSEDFVEVKDWQFVELTDQVEKTQLCKLPGYLNAAAVTNKTIRLSGTSGAGNITAKGTKYYLNKNYTIENRQRIFNKVPVVYTGNYGVSKAGLSGNNDNVFVDSGGYIVSLV